MAKRKIIVVDKEGELTFLLGDLKIAARLIGRSHRTVEKWFYNSNYRDTGRFIIAKNPYEVKSRAGGLVTDDFLKHRFKKKDESTN